MLDRYINALDRGHAMRCIMVLVSLTGVCGRGRYGPRVIDLDILFYGDRQLDLPGTWHNRGERGCRAINSSAPSIPSHIVVTLSASFCAVCSGRGSGCG